MKTSILFLTVPLSILFYGCNRQPGSFENSTNAIIGDFSFIQKFGVAPNAATNEDVRLQIHLEYVEGVLRSKDVSLMPAFQKKNRARMLDLLHEYWTAGVFPRNHDFPDRRIPCFIDRDGRICAVGYLIEKTVGRYAAEEINSKHKYEYLLAMDDTGINDWIQSSGLTKEECAMIQPTYGGTYGPDYVSPAYGVSSALASGLNISLMTVNGIQIARGANGKAVPVIGILSGIGQVALGAFSYPTDKVDTWGDGQPSKRNVCLMNIGIGTSTLILSSWNLITQKKAKEKSFSWNVYGYPTQARSVGVGFSLKKRL